MIFNLISIFIALLVAYHFFLKAKLMFICFLPFIIQYLWMFASILVIEQGAYISEQDAYGKFIYTNFYLLVFFVVTIVSFIFFFIVFDKAFKLELPRLKLFEKNEISLIYFLAIVVISIGLLSLMSSPSVYTSDEITKFNYWNTAKYPFLKGILGSTIGYLPFIFGLIFSKFKKATVLLVILYLIYLVGVDQKFTAFLYGIVGFLISYSLMNYNMRKNYNILGFKKRYLIIIGSLIFTLVFIKYSNKNPFAYINLTPLESVFYRAFGLQAHVFYGINEKYVYNDSPNTWDISELSYGMHIVMKEFTPEFHQQYLEKLWAGGVSWTNAYPAILLRIFPVPIALIVHFFIFSLVPLVYVFLIKTIRKKNYLVAIVLFQLSLWIVNIYSMAYFYRLTKVLVIFLFLALLSFIYNKAKQQT